MANKQPDEDKKPLVVEELVDVQDHEDDDHDVGRLKYDLELERDRMGQRVGQ